ncbi:MAG: ABC transporter ATP-binding protein [Firmicutes bacterium]|nr:ABC transporter ATP-binding protein [Bacillota bacterium]
MEYVVETHKLTKRYRGGGGCFEVDLKVPRGSVFGLLGPNGAGKSTLVKSLVGLVKPSSGSGTILGRPLGSIEIRRDIGYLPETFRYQPWMTGEELLFFHAKLRKVPPEVAEERIPELLKLMKLSGQGKQKIKTYSKGMQQRIGMACALISDPQLVFLDEPTSALDPVGRRETRELILRLKEQGKTIFLNSHFLGEVEMVCDQVAVMNVGRLLALGPLNELRGLQVVVDLRVKGLSEQVLTALRNLALKVARDGDRVSLVLAEAGMIPRVAKVIAASGGELYEMIPRTKDLEELFMDVIQNRGIKKGPA